MTRLASKHLAIHLQVQTIDIVVRPWPKHRIDRAIRVNTTDVVAGDPA